MSNITEVSNWAPVVNQVETGEVIVGGNAGRANLAISQLTNRSVYLKDETDSLGVRITNLETPGGGSVDADTLQGHPSSYFAQASHVHDLAVRFDTTGAKHGFMSAQDKMKLDDLNQNGGDADTLGGHPASYFSPTTHGHADVVSEGASGFMTGVDKQNLDLLFNGDKIYHKQITIPANSNITYIQNVIDSLPRYIPNTYGWGGYLIKFEDGIYNLTSSINLDRFYGPGDITLWGDNSYVGGGAHTNYDVDLNFTNTSSSYGSGIYINNCNVSQITIMCFNIHQHNVEQDSACFRIRNTPAFILADSINFWANSNVDGRCFDIGWNSCVYAIANYYSQYKSIFKVYLNSTLTCFNGAIHPSGIAPKYTFELPFTGASVFSNYYPQGSVGTTLATGTGNLQATTNILL